MSSGSFSLYDGTDEVAADLSVWDGTEEVPVQAAGVMPSGYPSVGSMLGSDPFYIAHRGGSADFPEMSLWAYTQSAAWGAPALELSLNKTSDGVLFGLHDATLDRTSTAAAGKNLDPRTLTWAEIQAGFTIDQYGRREPYERAEAILDVYAGSHLFFIDPKYLGSDEDLTDVFAMLKSFPSWERMVIKFSYDAQSVAMRSRAAGFRTWGYYYDADADHVSETADWWDILGMNYSATARSWGLVKAPGKPVIGHIVPTAAAAQTALSMGADGLMVSGVQEVIPGPKVFFG